MKIRPRCLLYGLIAAASGFCGACGSSESPGRSPTVAPAATGSVSRAVQPHPGPAELEPRGPVLEQQLAYGEAGKHNLVGYLAMPTDATEPLPGIIVIHEGWGLNDFTKKMARLLAGEGYVVLAVDLYGGAVATDSDSAQALMKTISADPDLVRANLEQAYAYLDKYALAPRIASVGWCLGAGWSLQAALLLPGKLDAAVMFYGQVITDRERLRALDVPVLGFFGASDKSVPVGEVQDFRAGLQALGKQAEVLIYPHVGHAFVNPSSGSYDATTAADAWQKTLEFLSVNLKMTPSSQ